MSKITYLICAINVVASAAAFFLIFRSPAKPQIGLPSHPQAIAEQVEPSVSPEALWHQFGQATTSQAAATILTKLPASNLSLGQVTVFVEQQTVEWPSGNEFVRMGRITAALRYLGAHCEWNDAGLLLAQKIAKDKQAPVILRDMALRAVVDASLRKHTTTGASDNAWRREFSDFLIQADFGTETSMAGLALQAAAFAQNQGIIKLDTNNLAGRLHEILDGRDGACESSFIAALEVCALVPETNMAEVVRAVVSAPRSDAVLQAAIISLGKVGSSEDRILLAKLPRKSAQIYHATEAAFFSLAVTGTGP